MRSASTSNHFDLLTKRHRCGRGGDRHVLSATKLDVGSLIPRKGIEYRLKSLI